jgi:hypothetical protein
MVIDEQALPSTFVVEQLGKGLLDLEKHIKHDLPPRELAEPLLESDSPPKQLPSLKSDRHPLSPSIWNIAGRGSSNSEATSAQSASVSSDRRTQDGNRRDVDRAISSLRIREGRPLKDAPLSRPEYGPATVNPS